MWLRVSWFLGLSLLFSTPLFAELTVYPGADPALACEFYEVRILQDDRVEDAFVYQSKSDWDQQSYFRHMQVHETLSYTGFAFTGAVTVEVTKVGRVRPGIPVMSRGGDRVEPPPPTGVLVRPLRHGVEPEIDGWTTRFTIDQPGQYSVEFADKDLGPDGTPLHGLMIFADPPEESWRIPETKDPAVLSLQADDTMPKNLTEIRKVRLEPGVHELGSWVVPTQIDQIYLAPGAFVKGCLSIRDRADGFVLNGRGVLSALHMGWQAKAFAGEEAGWSERSAPGKDYLKLLMIEGDNVLVDGIVLVDSPFQLIGSRGMSHTWSWVKVMGWRHQNDGILGRQGSVIRHCFIRANADAVRLCNNDLLVHDLVMWQGENGACFQLGWSSESVRHVTVRNIDVIHAEWGTERRRSNSGLLNFRIPRTSEHGPGVQENFLFENIRVESPVASGIDLRMRKEAGEGGGPHTFRNFVFCNVSLQLDTRFALARNYLVPWNEEYGFEHIRFENLRVNDVLITEANYASEGRFDIGTTAKDEVHFVARTRPFSWENPLTGLPSVATDPAIVFAHGAANLFAATPDGSLARWTSLDLNTWTSQGAVLEANLSWGEGPLRAPRLLHDPVRRLYFMVFQRGSEIGLASSPSLDGPWAVLNPDAPLATGSHPSLFADRGGHLYLVTDGVRMAKVDPREPTPVTDWVTLNHFDGTHPTVLKKNGRYHLFWTEAGDLATGHYAVARSVMGPYLPSLIASVPGPARVQPFPGPDGGVWVLGRAWNGATVTPLPFDDTAGLFVLESPDVRKWTVDLPTE